MSFDFKKDMRQTKVIGKINTPTNIIANGGKALANSAFEFDFLGIEVKQTNLIRAQDTVSKGLVSISRFASIIASLSMVVAACLPTQLLVFSRLIQVIEFNFLLELINIEYHPVVGSLLRNLNNQRPLKLLSGFVSEFVSSLISSKAGVWKGKLSWVDLKPLVLQEIGYVSMLALVSKLDFSDLN